MMTKKKKNSKVAVYQTTVCCVSNTHTLLRSPYFEKRDHFKDKLQRIAAWNEAFHACAACRDSVIKSQSMTSL